MAAARPLRDLKAAALSMLVSTFCTDFTVDESILHDLFVHCNFCTFLCNPKKAFAQHSTEAPSGYYSSQSGKCGSLTTIGLSCVCLTRKDGSIIRNKYENRVLQSAAYK